MSNFEQRLNQAKNQSKKNFLLPENDFQEKKDILFIRVVFDLLAPIILCVALGYGIGHVFDHKSLWIIIFFVFGCVVGLYNVYKITMRK